MRLISNNPHFIFFSLHLFPSWRSCPLGLSHEASRPPRMESAHHSFQLWLCLWVFQSPSAISVLHVGPAMSFAPGIDAHIFGCMPLRTGEHKPFSCNSYLSDVTQFSWFFLEWPMIFYSVCVEWIHFSILHQFPQRIRISANIRLCPSCMLRRQILIIPQSMFPVNRETLFLLYLHGSATLGGMVNPIRLQLHLSITKGAPKHQKPVPVTTPSEVQ